jgi:hypothetical protein
MNNLVNRSNLFVVSGNYGGVRFLNLSLKGGVGGTGIRNGGIFLYEGAHDVTMCNLDFDAFSLAVYNESSGKTVTNNIKLTGSRIVNSSVIAYLGAGTNSEVSYNYWDGNGGTNMFDHTLYISAHHPVSNMKVVGNYIHGQYGPTCLGAPIVGHAAIDGLLVENNVVDIDAAAATGGCWGIGFGFGGNPEAVYLRNSRFAGNIIKNGGNLALSVANCPDCVIENNLIIQDWTYGPTGNWSLIGIIVPSELARAGLDDVSNRNLIRNNTIWFGPNATGGGTGIKVGTEGTGHVIANNTVYYSSTSAGQGVKCFDYTLSLDSFAFINNNHCHSNTSTFKWEVARGTLAEWQTAAPGFDSSSITGNPLFTAAGTIFTPAVGSPLINAGDTTNKSAADITGKARPLSPAKPAIGAYEP